MHNIQAYADKLNLKQTKIQRYMMDFEASKQGRENYLTVNDYHKLLCHIYDNRHLARFNIAWQILARQQFRDRIPYIGMRISYSIIKQVCLILSNMMVVF